MKKIIVMVSAIMMVAGISAEPKSVEPFDQVNVGVPSRVRIVKGDEYGIQIISANHNVDQKLTYYVQDGVLQIKVNDREMLEDSPRNTVITIITPADKTEIKAGEDMTKLYQKKYNNR